MSVLSYWRSRNLFLVLSIFLLGLVFLITGCSTSQAELDFDKISKRFIGFRLDDYDKHEEEKRKVMEVREQRFLNVLKQVLQKATPTTEVPDPNTWREHTSTFYMTDGSEAGPYVFRYEREPRTEKSIYIEFPDGWYEIPGQFNSLLQALLQYPSASAEVNPADEDFLRQYGWSPFFRISTKHLQLPSAFQHRPGEYPIVLYWAYNNELNKDIGLDLTPYLGQTVEVSLYKISELLPEFMEPRRSTGRVVLVRSQGELIGAWLDAGRHSSFASSLKGQRLEEITGQTWEEWVSGLVDPQDPIEQKLANLTPEQIIRGYYAAVDRGDFSAAHTYESRRALTRYLSNNMDNNFLFNTGYPEKKSRGMSNTTAAKVISIKKLEGSLGNPRPGWREYAVKVDLQVKQPITHGNGPQTRFIILSQEPPTMGWRIDSIGTGP